MWSNTLTSIKIQAGPISESDIVAFANDLAKNRLPNLNKLELVIPVKASISFQVKEWFDSKEFVKLTLGVISPEKLPEWAQKWTDELAKNAECGQVSYYEKDLAIYPVSSF